MGENKVFRIGDKVRIVNSSSFMNGLCGEIDSLSSSYSLFPYRVTVVDGEETYPEIPFFAHELESI